MKLVNLVGFITKKSVTMHGHMNVPSEAFILFSYDKLGVEIYNMDHGAQWEM